MHLTVLGQPIILLGTHEVAVDLLEKPSAKYSDRRLSVMAQLYVTTSRFACMLTALKRSTIPSIGQTSPGFSPSIHTARSGARQGRLSMRP